LTPFFMLTLATAALPSTPFGPSDDAAWEQMLRRQCPAHRIQRWMPDGQKADLIYDFIDGLPPRSRARAKRLAFAGKICAAEQAGQSCEAIVGLHAVRQLGLLSQFSSYICSRASCSEPAVCESPMPRGTRP